MMKIAFDVDDTLIIPRIVTGMPFETPNYDTVALFKWFQLQGCEMIVWSGGGIEWAKNWAERLNLQPCTIRIKEKSEDVDICFDDCDVDLAKVNVKVKRIKNSIDRKDYNLHTDFFEANPSVDNSTQDTHDMVK